MGVTGLWNLIDPSGKPVPVETLENKILAVDISIWLHQAVKGFQDNRGSALSNAHLLGLFHRLCKLMYYRIRPIFVFDGQVPQLKLETIAKRNQTRNRILNEAQRKEALLLNSLAREKVVQQALGSNAAEILLSPSKSKSLNKYDSEYDMFKLPALPEVQKEEEKNEYDSQCSTSDFDNSFEENPRNYYDCNLQSIDVTSSQFKNLPADVRHELLTDIKETRKQSSWGRLHELPAKNIEFSTFQMEKLLKRRQVQVSLEDAEKEMGGKSLSFSELQKMFLEDGIIDPDSITGTKQIASNENTRFLLVKNLKKAMNTKNNEDRSQPSTSTASEKNQNKAEPIVVPSFTSPNPSTQNKTETNLCVQGKCEFENADLDLAIQMSLEENIVYDEEYYDCDKIKMSEIQRSQLKDSAKSLARAYMIEYGGMNDDDINELVQDEENLEASFNFRHTDSICLKSTEIYKESSENDQSLESSTINLCSDSESDSNFIEVSDDDNHNLPKEQSKLEIRLNFNNEYKLENDIFADVFKTASEIPELESDNLKNEQTEGDIIKIFDSQEPIEDQRSPKDVCFDQSPPKAKPIDTKKILDSLKSDKSNVSKLQLHDIKIVDNLSTTNDLIEICDEHSKCKTPSKQKISGYFETQYIVKRTPDKETIDKDEDIPKTVSPFFLNKTRSSGSGKKRKCNQNDTPSVLKKNRSVSKTLFENKEDNPTSTSMQEVVEMIKENKTKEELEKIALNIAKERNDLELERNRQNRMGASITDKMRLECMELLKLFGVPYIVAPMEAEAQCAFLESVKLTHGTITDDSDIWLFGGKTVYKNFFMQNKHVMEFRMDNITKKFNVERQNLIQLAILVGSDYTTGIHGIGAVTALEILATFSESLEKERNVLQIPAGTVISSLQNFRDWLQNDKALPGTSAKHALRKKLKNIELQTGFPNIAIVHAYLSPTVNENREQFSWGCPQVELIREFTRKHLGWTSKKTDEILLPVIDRFNNKKTQSTITNYFSMKTISNHGIELKVSKRVQKAIHKLSADYKSEEDEHKTSKIKRRLTKTKKAKTSSTSTTDMTMRQSTSDVKITKKDTNVIECIPQRKKDQEDMKEKKAKAAQILKSKAQKKKSE